MLPKTTRIDAPSRSNNPRTAPPVVSSSLLHLSLYILQGEFVHESERTIKRTEQTSLFALCESVCICMCLLKCCCCVLFFVLSFAELRLWACGSVYLTPSCLSSTDRVCTLSYRRRSLTWWLHIHHLPPELTLTLNGNTLFPPCGWVWKTPPALIIVQTTLRVSSPFILCCEVFVWCVHIEQSPDCHALITDQDETLRRWFKTKHTNIFGIHFYDKSSAEIGMLTKVLAFV